MTNEDLIDILRLRLASVTRLEREVVDLRTKLEDQARNTSSEAMSKILAMRDEELKAAEQADREHAMFVAAVWEALPGLDPFNDVPNEGTVLEALKNELAVPRKRWISEAERANAAWNECQRILDEKRGLGRDIDEAVRTTAQRVLNRMEKFEAGRAPLPILAGEEADGSGPEHDIFKVGMHLIGLLLPGHKLYGPLRAQLIEEASDEEERIAAGSLPPSSAMPEPVRVEAADVPSLAAALHNLLIPSHPLYDQLAALAEDRLGFTGPRRSGSGRLTGAPVFEADTRNGIGEIIHGAAGYAARHFAPFMRIPLGPEDMAKTSAEKIDLATGRILTRSIEAGVVTFLRRAPLISTKALNRVERPELLGFVLSEHAAQDLSTDRRVAEWKQALLGYQGRLTNFLADLEQLLYVKIQLEDVDGKVY